MRVNPKLANLQYMYANGDTTSALPEGTLSNLAAVKYVKDNDKNKDKCLSIDEVTLSQAAFDKLDADKNGKIDLKEMKAGLKGQDEAIQAYYSGKKTAADPTSGLLEPTTSDSSASTYSAKAAASFISANDKDKDGSLTHTEAGLSTAAFDNLDTDKNGKLSATEVQAGLKAREADFQALYKNNATAKAIADLTKSVLQTAPTQAATPYSAKAAASHIGDRDADKDNSLSRTEAGLSPAAFDKLDTDKNGKLSATEVQAGIRSKEKTFATYYKNKVSSNTIGNLTSNLLKTI